MIGPMFPVDLPRAVLGFVGVHLGLRAEVAHVERLYAAGDLAAAGRRAALLGRVIHHHHRAEDTLLFPALTARNPGAAVTTEELETQHAGLDAALRVLVEDLATIDRVGDLVARHLSDEERLVLPLWISSFTTAEHERFAGALRRSTPLRDAGMMIAWLLDTSPDDAVDIAWSQVPSSLRVLHRMWWRRRYERAFGSSRGQAAAAAATPLVAAAT